MTDAERKLWSGLRAEQLGVKFRRQHPRGNYIADFACLNPKLIAFGSNDPLQNLEGVLTAIHEQLKTLAGDAPIPAFPQRGKEKDTRSHP